MSQESVTKRPLTPFFLYREKERKMGNDLTAKEAGVKWKKLKEPEKNKYFEEYHKAKERYDKYVQEVYGVDIGAYKSGANKKHGYSTARIRAILGREPDLKPMKREAYPALTKLRVLTVKC